MKGFLLLAFFDVSPVKEGYSTPTGKLEDRTAHQYSGLGCSRIFSFQVSSHYYVNCLEPGLRMTHHSAHTSRKCFDSEYNFFASAPSNIQPEGHGREKAAKPYRLSVASSRILRVVRG